MIDAVALYQAVILALGPFAIGWCLSDVLLRIVDFRDATAPRTWDLRFLVHNLLHPLAGVAWFLGFEAAGDWIHSIGEPE